MLAFLINMYIYNIIMEMSFIYIVSTVVLERSGTTSAPYDFKQHCGKILANSLIIRNLRNY